MAENTLIIWGAGKLGKTAYSYFADQYKKILFVDVDSAKWGRTINGILVYKPEDVQFFGCDVVIASKHNIKDIIDEIAKKVGVRSITVFRIGLESLDNASDNEHTRALDIGKGHYIISFSGGLGNQLFQYAFMRNVVEKKDAIVWGNIYRCMLPGSRPFIINDVFNNTRLDRIIVNDKWIRNAVYKNEFMGKFLFYNEDMSLGVEKKCEPDLIDNTEGGIFTGFFQTAFWAEKVRHQLLDELRFREDEEEQLANLIKLICEDENAVSVHVRRGDYCTERNNFLYGGICTREYYNAAIAYVNGFTKANYYVFSDDVEYVKNHYNIPNAKFIVKDMFKKYEDWYDMCLMSKCKHNIIANSTFSWWGAWFNTNEGKIVIAPDRWINSFEYEDIYPEKWLRIDACGTLM